MKTQGNRTFMGTVVFLDLGETASASPAPDLQQRVRDVVSRTVGHLPATERILLGHGQRRSRLLSRGPRRRASS